MPLHAFDQREFSSRYFSTIEPRVIGLPGIEKGKPLMRIYTRAENQGLLIDGDINVTVLAVYRDHVRIGINSARHEPAYWETDLYLPDHADLASIELELTIN